MTTLKPAIDIESNTQLLLEGLAELLIPLLDMTDQKTSEFYWIFVGMQSASILASMKAAASVRALKLAAPAPDSK